MNFVYRALFVFEYGLYNHWSDLMTLYVLNIGKMFLKVGEKEFPDGVKSIYDVLEVKKTIGHQFYLLIFTLHSFY